MQPEEPMAPIQPVHRLALALILGAIGAATQAGQVELGARWIPTDLNYGVLKDLRQNSLQSPADQIAGKNGQGCAVLSVQITPVSTNTCRACMSVELRYKAIPPHLRLGL